MVHVLLFTLCRCKAQKKRTPCFVFALMRAAGKAMYRRTKAALHICSSCHFCAVYHLCYPQTGNSYAVRPRNKIYGRDSSGRKRVSGFLSFPWVPILAGKRRPIMRRRSRRCLLRAPCSPFQSTWRVRMDGLVKGRKRREQTKGEELDRCKKEGGKQGILTSQCSA